MLTKEQDEKLNELCRLAFESLIGQMIIDKDGIILYFSKEHTKYTGIESSDAVGKHVREVLPNTRMDIVLESGQPEFGRIFEMTHVLTGERKYMVCNRVPIYAKSGAIIGAMSETVFSRGIHDIHRLNYEVSRHGNPDSFANEEEKEALADGLLSMKKDQYVQHDDGLWITGIRGVSPQISELRKFIARIADMPLPVLITGETGTGKEVFADALHTSSELRRDKNFVKINCAAIPAELLESELFGYEKGAFSGANSSGKIGKFEYAGNGTLLLDEIGDMPMDLQAKLLRVLQEKEFERIGGLKPIPFHARIICTTNKDVLQLVKEGRFREDLYYRINTLEMSIPALRERKEDILDLSKFFILQINSEFGLDILGIDKEAEDFLSGYNWPGNVRELKHVIERACMLRGSGQLNIHDFSFLLTRMDPSDSADSAGAEPQTLDLRTIKMQAEKEAIARALKATDGNKASAAQLLGIERTVLYDKLKKYDIQL